MSKFLDKIEKIEGKKYEWNDSMEHLTGKSGSNYGVIAQSIQEHFPEMIVEDSSGYLKVDYIQLIPIMIEAIKELKNEIDCLKEINKLSSTSLISPNYE